MSAEKSERINVSLNPDAIEAMELLQERTGLKKVELVNRALMLMEFVESEMRQGREVTVHNPRRPGEPGQRIKLFF